MELHRIFFFIKCTGCSSEDISKLAESGKKNETESDATVDGTVTPNEGREKPGVFI